MEIQPAQGILRWGRESTDKAGNKHMPWGTKTQGGDSKLFHGEQLYMHGLITGTIEDRRKWTWAHDLAEGYYPTSRISMHVQFLGHLEHPRPTIALLRQPCIPRHKSINCSLKIWSPTVLAFPEDQSDLCRSQFWYISRSELAGSKVKGWAYYVFLQPLD